MKFKKVISIPDLLGLRASKRIRLALMILVLIGGTTSLAASSYSLFFGTNRTLKGTNVVASNSSPSIVALTAQNLWNGQRPTSALVTITPRGFEPANLTLPAGRLLLMVDNRSGLAGEIKLEMKVRRVPILLKADSRDTGTGRPQVFLPREKVNWRNLIDLPPGDYLLTEVAHPLWTCRINVTAP